MNRRNFIKKSALTLTGASFLSGLYAWQIEPFWLEFVYKKMPIQNLPQHLIRKTLMQISDIHVGNKFDYQFIINSFKIAQLLKPDFVVYTGDFVTYESSEQIKQLNEVLKHVVKGKEATLGILGNHDYGKNFSEQSVANEISSSLNKSGVTVLSNEQVSINGLSFIGFDDFWGKNFNPEKAMRNYNKTKATIALCHNPDVCDLDIWKDYQGWILAGHTHGGQCKPPFLSPPLLPVKNKNYTSGEIDLGDGRRLYINRALGNLKQIRFNVRPEITIFELN